MLVVCQCGKKLNVPDKFAGKKVRCPICKEITLAEEVEAEDKDDNITEKKGSKRPTEQDSRPKRDLVMPTRKTGARGKSRREDDDLEDDELPGSSGKNHKGSSKAKPGVPVWRKVASGVVLGILLIVFGVVIYLRLTANVGTVELTIRSFDYSVFIDGKKWESNQKLEDAVLAIDLPPGNHEIKVTKEGCQTFTRQVLVKVGAKEELTIDLPPIRRSGQGMARPPNRWKLQIHL
jgi:PEGA domain